jgi:hypothetical protein
VCCWFIGKIREIRRGGKESGGVLGLTRKNNFVVQTKKSSALLYSSPASSIFSYKSTVA